MRICIWGDNHWAQYSSIVRKRGQKYSLRLENSIQSLNWAEQMAVAKNCDIIVCLGDFFDQPTLNAEEITALKEIQWSNIPKYFIVGNHEMGRSDLAYSSAHLFKYIPKANVISTLTRMVLNDFDDIFFVPYILEENRNELSRMFGLKTGKRYVFSHNDIKGIQMGRIISPQGFELSDIQNSCDWFFNGHIHNGSQVANRVINVGNLTGQNFSEDAFKYSHDLLVFDTQTDYCEVYENPYAFNFYKVSYPYDFTKLKNNSIITVSVDADKAEICKKFIQDSPNILEYRLVVNTVMPTVHKSDVKSLSLDHIDEFKKYVLENIGNDEIVQSELLNIFNGGM